ncbi:Uncharacterised protein [Burkholderia pseudomallei]|nr:Uncharacterised protein [Burkholderia pseudomallei]
MFAPEVTATSVSPSMPACSAYRFAPATASEPAGSSTLRVSWNTSLIAAQSASVSTVTTSSRYAAQRRNVSSPTSLTAVPSEKSPAPARRERLLHRARIVGLHADHLDLRAHRLHVRGHARREPAAADRHEDRVNRPLMLAQDLHRDRALARDHVRIVERMDEREAALGLHLHRVRVRVAVRFARLDHLDGRSAVRAHRVDLHLRRRHRHDDHRLHVHPRGRERDALRMVARRRGDHPARERVGRDVRHLVVRAAQLEREHRLVVLALQVDRVAQPCGQVVRAFELGFERDVVHPGGQDFLQIIVGGHEEARKSVDAAENGNDSANLRRFGLGRMATDRPDGEFAVARPPSAD